MKIDDVTKYLQSIRQDAFFIDYDVLETEPYEIKGKETRVEIVNPEFTSLCPRPASPTSAPFASATCGQADRRAEIPEILFFTIPQRRHFL